MRRIYAKYFIFKIKNRKYKFNMYIVHDIMKIIIGVDLFLRKSIEYFFNLNKKKLNRRNSTRIFYQITIFVGSIFDLFFTMILRKSLLFFINKCLK